MVHGLLVSSRYMLPTAVRLASYCHVHIPDLPGYGKSDKPREVLDVPRLADALHAYVEAAGLGRVVLLGNSFGCQIAVDYAARYPERVARVVLAGPTVEPSQRTLAKVVPYWLVNLRGEPPSLWLVCFRDFLDMGPRRLIGTFQHMLADRIEDKLPRVLAPTLVVRGQHDTTVPRHWALEMVRLLPHGLLTEVPGAAHTVNFNAPARFERLVRPFVLHGAAGVAGAAGGTEVAPTVRGAS
jgi:2-hydroxy-6-oxonona-2,4-dienedioate hydrolase